MIAIDPASQSERENYKLLTGSIIPRPIAFVTTLSAEGVLNAAPFSYFNIVTADPPMVSISVQRWNGERKDTSRNATLQGEFVVHISSEDYVAQINETAANLPPEESEVALAGLTPVASTRIAVPGIAEAKVRMECVLELAIPLGGTDHAPACDLLIGRVVCFHVDESLLVGGHSGRLDPNVLKPVSRLAGSGYAKLGALFEIERPQ
jgi:flavin reductase (DIM6/NTAB) family NADH-FMN oxidoreductase RutF